MNFARILQPLQKLGCNEVSPHTQFINGIFGVGVKWGVGEWWYIKWSCSWYDYYNTVLNFQFLRCQGYDYTYFCAKFRYRVSGDREEIRRTTLFRLIIMIMLLACPQHVSGKPNQNHLPFTITPKPKLIFFVCPPNTFIWINSTTSSGVECGQDEDLGSAVRFSSRYLTASTTQSIFLWWRILGVHLLQLISGDDDDDGYVQKFLDFGWNCTMWVVINISAVVWLSRCLIGWEFYSANTDGRCS